MRLCRSGTIRGLGPHPVPLTLTRWPRLDCRPRRTRTQPEKHRRRHAARAARRDYGPVRLRQVVAGLRHDLRRGPAALRRVAVGLRPAVPRADGEAGRRPASRVCRRPSPSSRRRRRATRGRPSAPSPRSTTTCGCCSRTSACRTARTADAEIASQSLERIIDLVMTYPQDERINVLAPIVRGRKGEFKKELEALRTRGFTKARIDGLFRSLEDDIKLDRRKNHTIEVVVDRLVVRSGIERRLTESIETALQLGQRRSSSSTAWTKATGCSRGGWRACNCGISVPELVAARVLVQLAARRMPGVPGPRRHLGLRPGPHRARPVEVAGARARSRRGPAVTRSSWPTHWRRCRRRSASSWTRRSRSCPKKQRDLLLFGAGRPPSSRRAPRRSAAPSRLAATSRASCPTCAARYNEATWTLQEEMEPYRALRLCPACEGERLKPESRAVRVKGRRIAEYVNLPIAEAGTRLRDAGALRSRVDHRRPHPEGDPGSAALPERRRRRLSHALAAARRRCRAAKASASASRRKSGRTSPACCTSSTSRRSACTNGTIGRSSNTLARLRDLGNTVIVVEHDEETIRKADYVIDLGPGAGEHGGRVIFQGPPAELLGTGPD